MDLCNQNGFSLGFYVKPYFTNLLVSMRLAILVLSCSPGLLFAMACGGIEAQFGACWLNEPHRSRDCNRHLAQEMLGIPCKLEVVAAPMREAEPPGHI